MSKLFAMSVPILPGKEKEWKNWIADLNGKYYKDFKESRARMKVHERSFLQHTPAGDTVVVTLEGDDPENAFKSFGKGDSEFTRWFVENVKNIHGMDLTTPPPGPTPELIVDSEKA